MKGKKKKVGLALSGGAAKGLAHIGVIQGLEELDIEISVIAGTSMGAIVGGWYAATKNIASLAELVRRYQEWGFTWKNISPRKVGAVFNTAKMEQFLRNHLGSPLIENLEIPYAAVATDAISGEAVVLTRGDLVKAMLASSAIPSIFPPVRWPDENGKEHILVDGWLVNPLPFNAARDLGAELVIGVDVLRGTTKMVPLYFVPRKQKTWHLLAVIYDIFEMMQQQLTRLHMQEGDVLLTPTMGSIRAIDFKKVDDAIRVGREEVMENAKAILAAIGEDPKH